MNNDLGNQNNKALQAAIEIAQIMNFRAHAKQLHIPVLKDFEIKEDRNPQTVLLATGHGFIEQLTSDGYIKDDEFEQKIALNIEGAKKFMADNNCENIDNSIIYHKDYSNGLFNFKLYVFDIIIPGNNEKKIIRQLNAFFVEPKMHDFYQLSLSVGPYTMPVEQLKVGVIDLENDQITRSLDNLMKLLMDNLKYKN